MAQIEDVAGPAGRAIEDGLHAAADVRGLRQEHHRVEVPLHRDVVAHGRPRGVEIDAPVQADHVAARRPHVRQERRGAGAEVDDGRPRRQRTDQSLRVRHHEGAIVVGRQHADPRVEDLHSLGAGRDLGVEVARGCRDQDPHEAGPALGLLVHQPLGVEVITRRPALDDVGRDRERRAREADERHFSAERLLHSPHRLEHERHRGVDVDRAEPSDLRLAANGTMDDGPFALRELEADTERLDDQEDVGEEDRRVDAEAVDGLQRDFGRRLRVPGKLEESVPLAHRPILRQIAAGLPHEPDGSVRRRRPARGAQQECI